MHPGLRVFPGLLILFCLATSAFGQSALSDKLLKLTSQSDSINSRMPAESILMQFDKPYYAINATLWFKGYILNNSYLTPSAKSGFLYVDIANASGVLVKQLRFIATSGLSWGDVELNEKEFKPGAYLVRTYTTWMRNFGEEHFLYESFAIADSSGRVPPPLKYKQPVSSAKNQAGKPAYASSEGINFSSSLLADSVQLTINASDSVLQQQRSCFLIAKARGVVCYAAVVNLNKKQFRKTLPVNMFPSGTAYLSLLDTTGKPFITNAITIDHHDALNLAINTNKPVYTSRDSIALQLQVTDAAGQPVAGNFSVAVTDDSQVSLPEEKYPGVVVNAAQGETPSESDPSRLKFPAEPEFVVAGKVVNVSGNPMQMASVTLLSRKPSVLSEASTSADGHFVFRNIPLSDTAIFVLQAKNKRGRMFNVDIRMDDPGPPAFSKSSIIQEAPPAVAVRDTTATVMVKKQEQRRQYIDKLTGVSHHLKEVKIVAKKIVKESKNWNGGGNADFVVDEKELEKAGRKTLLQLLYEKVPGFREGLIQAKDAKVWPPDVIAFDTYIKGTKEPSPWYFVQGKVALLFVDGIDVKSFVEPFVFTDYKSYLENNFADDVKGVEVNVSAQYTNAYLRHFQMPLQELNYRDFAFIELTTRSGGGPHIQHGIGSYLYKPIALSYPSQFNSPKYTEKKTAKDAPDVRSTVFWSPNVATGKNGQATLSFYSADGPATYTVTITGTDMNGSFGSATYKVKVE